MGLKYGVLFVFASFVVQGFAQYRAKMNTDPDSLLMITLVTKKEDLSPLSTDVPASSSKKEYWEGTFFDSPVSGLQISLSETQEKYIRFNFSSQIWLRKIENNPGTMVNGHPSESTYDASIRRMRIQTTAQLGNNYKIVLQYGINNQSFISGGGSGTGALGQGKKPILFFMDAYNELAIIPGSGAGATEKKRYSLYIGAGLHPWMGVSRMTNASSTKALLLDLPIFNFPNIEVSDQFARQIGVFTHGEVGRFRYRFSLNKPFATSLEPEVGGPAVDNNSLGKLSFTGYGVYQLLDREATSAFFPGTYIGKEKIFNIGSGFYVNKAATKSQPVADEFVWHDQHYLGIDVFLNLPVGDASREMTLTAYGVYYNYQFGPRYLRNVALINPGVRDPDYEGKVALEGFGNARNLLGTGHMLYSQFGLVLPKFSDKVKVQPFAAYTYKDLEGLNGIGHFYDVGMNVYLGSQNTRISYNYSSRPLFSESTRTSFSRRGEHILGLLFSL